MAISYDSLRSLIGDVNLIGENPDSIFHFATDFTTFIYLPKDNSLYTDESGETHASMKYGNSELKKKIKNQAVRSYGIINGRITTDDSYPLIRQGFTGVVSFWGSTIRYKSELQKCLKKLLDEFLIEPHFLVLPGKWQPGLVVDILGGTTEESTGYSSRVNELMGIFHAGTIEAKQKAYAELQKLSSDHPEDEKLSALVRGLEYRLPSSIKKNVTVSKIDYSPGSGLEKLWGRDPEEVRKTAERLGMKRNPVTGYLEMNFKEWLHQVDERAIDSVYDKAYIAVELVRMYENTLPMNKKLLNNISTIANLPSGAYGLYNSSENKNIIPPDIRLKFGATAFQNKLENVPRVVLRKYLKDNGMEHIKVAPSDVIHINVNRILQEQGDSPEAIIEIASTIVHEATHELERETTGQTSETGPQLAERQFLNWFKINKTNIVKKFPFLNSLRVV